MKVLKFGGTSVGSVEAIRSVSKIVSSLTEAGDLCVVSSAFSGVTNDLIAVAQAARDGRDAEMQSLRHRIVERHMHAARELVVGASRPVEVSEMLENLADHLKGIGLLRELSARTQDLIMSFGEKLSCTLLAYVLRDAMPGRNVEMLDARRIIRTDDSFGCAVVNFDVTNEAIRKVFAERPKGTVYVVTGFIGSTCTASGELGETVTLGRGGGDYTASIIGGALKADEIQIWTDVDGVMTAHPGIVGVENVQVIDHISYEEAMEMSYFGAKVIYAPTMGPAMRTDVPLRIRNTFNPAAPGTLIDRQGGDDSHKIRCITGIDSVSLLHLEGHGMVGVAGVAGRLFSTIARQKISVIMISQASSEHSICLAIAPGDAEKAKQCVDHEFEKERERGLVESIKVQGDLAVVAIVGDQMRRTAGIAGLVAGTLGEHGVNIVAIAQGASEMNISLVVQRESTEHAVRVLHHAFFSPVTARQAWMLQTAQPRVPIPPTVLSVYIVSGKEPEDDSGSVAGHFIDKLWMSSERLLQERNVRLRVMGVAHASTMLLGRRGQHGRVSPVQLTRQGSSTADAVGDMHKKPSSSSLNDLLTEGSDAVREPLDMGRFVETCRAQAARASVTHSSCVVLVDVSESVSPHLQYVQLLAARVHVVSSNRTLFRQIPEDAFCEANAMSMRSGAPRFYYASALGLDPAAAASFRALRSAWPVSKVVHVREGGPPDALVAHATLLAAFAGYDSARCAADVRVSGGEDYVQFTVCKDAAVVTPVSDDHVHARALVVHSPSGQSHIETTEGAEMLAGTLYTDMVSCAM